MRFHKHYDKSEQNDIIFIIHDIEFLNNIQLTENEYSYAHSLLENEKSFIFINRYEQRIFIIKIDLSKAHNVALNNCRCETSKIINLVKENKITDITIQSFVGAEFELAVAQGLASVNYQFSKYFTSKDKLHQLSNIYFVSPDITQKQLDELQYLYEAVYLARDLVNEPVIFMNTPKFAEVLINNASEVGYDIKVYNKTEIELNKMGGILSVNMGSVDPPLFVEMTYKPENAKNEKPICLVGKGIVFDTGGLSLKNTKDSMDQMKSDMAGAAVVAGVLYAIAKNKLPIYIKAFIPITDNRPGGNAITPGDVITMQDGTSVEILNTDAEGRLVLADAISFANQYEPTLILTIATLTGAAHHALGNQALAVMSNADDNINKLLEEVSQKTYERIVFFPLWEEYKEQLQSYIADLKNIGSSTAGMITAGKFLEHFAKHPLIHFDIAGVSYNTTQEKYIPKGASGIGVRLIYEFLKKV